MEAAAVIEHGVWRHIKRIYLFSAPPICNRRGPDYDDARATGDFVELTRAYLKSWASQKQMPESH